MKQIPRARIIAIVMGLCVIGDSMLYVTLPASYVDLGLDSRVTGLILSANRFTRIAFNPLASVLVGKLGFRKSAILSACLALTCTLGYSIVQSPVVWVSLRVIWGLVWSIIRLTAFLATLEESVPGKSGQALGTMQRLVRIGSITGTFGGGFLMDRLGFRGAAGVLGVVTCLALPLALSVKDRSRPHTAIGDAASDGATGEGTGDGGKETGAGPRKHGATGAAASIPPREPGAPARDWSGILRSIRRGLVVYGSTFGLAVAVAGIFISTTGALFRELFAGRREVLVFGVAWGLGSLVGFIQSFRWLSDILFAPSIGRLSDRYGRALPLFGIALAEFVAGSVIWLYRGIEAITLAEIALFIAHSFALVVLSSAAADLGKVENPSVPMTIYATCLDVGDAIGPMVAYFLIDLGARAAYLVGVVVIGLVVAGWAYLLVRSRRVSRPEAAAR